MVLQIAYVSSTRTPPTSDQIIAILDQSRRNNARDGITGLLVWDDWLFFQVLEGDAAAVEACYDRISEDGRHGSLYLVMKTQAEDRAFPDWSMAVKQPGDLGPEGQHAVRSLKDLMTEGGPTLGTDPVIAELARAILAETAAR